MKVYIDKLRIRDVKHLAKQLKTSPKELNELCNNISTSPQKYYIQWTKITKKGKERPMVKIHGRLREILDELKNLLISPVGLRLEGQDFCPGLALPGLRHVAGLESGLKLVSLLLTNHTLQSSSFCPLHCEFPLKKK